MTKEKERRGTIYLSQFFFLNSLKIKNIILQK